MVDDEKDRMNPCFGVFDWALQKLWLPAPVSSVERKNPLVGDCAV